VRKTTAGPGFPQHTQANAAALAATRLCDVKVSARVCVQQRGWAVAYVLLPRRPSRNALAGRIVWRGLEASR
jgi:hypothetical protein